MKKGLASADRIFIILGAVFGVLMIFSGVFLLIGFHAIRRLFFCRELPNLIYFRLKSKKPVILHGTFLSVRVLHRCSVFTLKTEPKTC